MGKIVYDEERNLAYGNGLIKLSGNTSDEQGNVASNFSALVNKGIAEQTVKDIQGNMTSMEMLWNDTGSTIVNFTTDTFNYERENANAISGMQIPNDFLAENAVQINQYNKTLLSKIDGKSVNEGHTTEKANEIDDSGVVREALADITKADTQAQTYNEASSIVGQSILGNISGNVTEGQTYDERVSINGSTLQNITKADTQAQTYDERVSINGGTLQNITKGDTQAQTYDERVNINGSTLQNITKDATVSQQLNNGSSIVGQSVLGNISGSANVPNDQKSFDEKAIVGATLDKKTEEEKSSES